MTKKILISLLTITIAFISGCSRQEEPKIPPQEVINNFLQQYRERKEPGKEGTMEFSGSVSYESGNDNATASGTLKAKVNGNDLENLLAELVLALRGKGKIGEQAGEIDVAATLRVANKNTVYVTLNKASIITDDPQVNLVIELISKMYLEKPFSFALPEEYKNTIKKGGFLSPSANQIPGDIAKTIARENPFLQLINTVNEEDRVYKVRVDIPMLTSYLKSFAEAAGEKVTEEELASYGDLEKYLEYELELDIGASPGYELENIKGTLKFLPQKESNSTGKVDIDISVGDEHAKGTIGLVFDEGSSKEMSLNIQFSSESNNKANFAWNPEKLEEEAEKFDLMKLFGGSESDFQGTKSKVNNGPSEKKTP